MENNASLEIFFINRKFSLKVNRTSKLLDTNINKKNECKTGKQIMDCQKII